MTPEILSTFYSFLTFCYCTSFVSQVDSASIISWYFNSNAHQAHFSVLISDLISGKTSKRCGYSDPLFHLPSLLNCIAWITTVLNLVVFQAFPEFKQRRRNLRGCQGMTFCYKLTVFLYRVGIPQKIFPTFENSPMFSIIFRGSREVFHVFFRVFFQANTGKKLRGKNHRKFHRTWKFDAKHSVNVLNVYLKCARKFNSHNGFLRAAR